MFFIHNSLFVGLFISLASYCIGLWLKKKTRSALANPLLIAIVLVIGFLPITGIDYEVYKRGSSLLTYLLTPATICLAVPLYEEFEQLKRNYKAVLSGIAAGTLASLCCILLLSIVLGLSHESFVTLLPKSITTAMGIGVSEELGGIVPVTVICIVITGVLGNVFAEQFLKLIRIKEPIAKGVAIGTSTHAVGTAKAMEMGNVEGAMSGLSIVVAGVLTVIGASLFALIF